MKSDIKANFVQLVEQQNSAEAVSWSQAEKWEYVIQEELDTLESRKTVNNGITQEQDSCRLKWVCKSKWTLNQKL